MCQPLLTGLEAQEANALVGLTFLLWHRLEDLWLNDNSISSLDDFLAALKGPSKSIKTLYLERNPCVSALQWYLHSGALAFYGCMPVF